MENGGKGIPGRGKKKFPLPAWDAPSSSGQKPRGRNKLGVSKKHEEGRVSYWESDRRKAW